MEVFDIVKTIIVSVCVTALIIAIIINFASSNKSNVRQQKKSIVETGTMFGFFVVYYIVLVLGIGNLTVSNTIINYAVQIVGMIVLIFSVYVNVDSRVKLGHNWANHIKIYENHTLVVEGYFKYFRHPLYSSLIYMFFAGGLIYLNYALVILNVLIFIPFMYYRAKQEETLLLDSYPEYKDYKKKVGMFFPKIGVRK